MAADVGPVVVGTDFSEPAGAALVEAQRLAVLLGARLEVVHVVETAPRAFRRRQADAWMESLALAPGSLVLRFGRPWVELARYATEAAAALLVVGSHGASGYQPLTPGATAARLTVQAGCPVLVVSPRVRSGRQERELTVAGRGGAAAGARDEPGEQ